MDMYTCSHDLQKKIGGQHFMLLMRRKSMAWNWAWLNLNRTSVASIVRFCTCIDANLPACVSK